MSATTQGESRRSSAGGRVVSSVRQGVESFVAAQNILLDLTAQQNALVIGVLRERVKMPRLRPGTSIAGIADRGIADLSAAGKIILDLAAGETALVVDGLKEGLHLPQAAGTVADVVRHRVDTLVDRQKRLLDAAADETHTVVESYQAGEGLKAGAAVAELARRSVEDFVATEKKFLDLAVEDVNAAVEAGKEGRKPSRRSRSKVLTQAAREGVDKLVDAQKKLLDLAIKQLEAEGKAVRAATELNEENGNEPPTPLSEVTQKGVHNLVKAQKSLMDLAVKPMKEPVNGDASQPARRPRRRKQ